MQGTNTLLQTSSGSARVVTSTVSVDLLRNGTYTDVSSYVSSWSIDRSVTTDVPQGSRLVTGYAVSQLTLNAIGNPLNNAQDAPWMWSPYNTASGAALFGASGRVETPIKVTAGLIYNYGTPSSAADTVTVFTGFIRSILISSDQGTAQIVCLDGSDRMRSQCNIPQIIGDYVQTNFIGGAVRQGLTGGKLIDYLFRANGFYSSPPPRNNCVLSVSGHGSLEPDYVVHADGSNTQYGSTLVAWDGPSETSSFQSSVIQYVQDVAPDAVTGKPKIKFSAGPDPQHGVFASWGLTAPVTIASSGFSFTAEAWIDFSNNLSVASGAPLWSLNLPVATSGVILGDKDIHIGFMGDTAPYMRINGNSPVIGTGTVASASRGWHYVMINVTGSGTSASASFTIDTLAPTVANGRVVTASGAWSTGVLTLPYAYLGSFDVNNTMGPGARARWESLQLTTESASAASAASNVAYMPTAYIEPSLNNLSVVPYNSNAQNSWSVAQDVAEAEFGMIFFDELGMATFWNRKHFAYAQPTAVASVTTTRNLEQLSTQEAVDSVANTVVVTGTPYTVQPPGWVWALTDIAGVHSKSSLDLFATFDNAAAGVNPVFAFLPVGGVTTFSSYRGCSTADGTGQCVSNLTITVSVFSQSAKIHVVNPNAFPVYLVSPSVDNTGTAIPTSSIGQPCLQLYGSAVTQVAPNTASGAGSSTTTTYQVSDAQSQTIYGQQSFSVPASSYLQDIVSAQSVAADLLSQLAYPFPLVTNLVISAVPGLQLGDRITVNDPGGTLLIGDFFIVGIAPNFDPTAGFTQALTLKPLGGPGALIWDIGTWDNYVWDGTF